MKIIVTGTAQELAKGIKVRLFGDTADYFKAMGLNLDPIEFVEVTDLQEKQGGITHEVSNYSGAR